MKVIMTSPGGKRYMTKPFGNGLCYEVFKENPNKGKPKKKGKNAGEIDTEEWKSCQCYPCNLYWALNSIVKFMLANPDEDATIQTEGKSIAGQLKAINNSLNTYLEKIKKEIVNE